MTKLFKIHKTFSDIFFFNDCGKCIEFFREMRQTKIPILSVIFEGALLVKLHKIHKKFWNIDLKKQNWKICCVDRSEPRSSKYSISKCDFLNLPKIAIFQFGGAEIPKIVIIQCAILKKRLKLRKQGREMTSRAWNLKENVFS